MRITRFVVAAAVILMAVGAPVVYADPIYPPGIYFEQGAQKLVFPSGTEVEIQSGATVDVQEGATTDHSSGVDLDGSTLTMDADADSFIVSSYDDTITATLGAGTGFFTIETGNLHVGNDTSGAGQSLNGEDAFIEGLLEVDGVAYLDGGAECNGTLTLANDETIVNSYNGTITMTVASDGYVDIATGNLRVGDGTPDGTINGEDCYIEGYTEIDGELELDGQLDADSTANFGDTVTFSKAAGNALVVTAGGLAEINSNIVMQNDETLSNSYDGTITATVASDGFFTVNTGNLHVGNAAGGATQTLNGEDAFIEGLLEVDGIGYFDGGLECNGTLTLANDETIVNSFDKYITMTVPSDGYVDISTGNLSVGDGTPDGPTINGEDAYIEGSLEVDGELEADGGIDCDGTMDVSGNVTMASALDVQGGDITLQNDETISNGYDGTITMTVASDGYVDIATGNLRVGDGTPDGPTINGEDAYIEGSLEVDGEFEADGAIDADSTVDVAGTLTAAGIVSIGTWARIPLETGIEVTDDSIITPTGTMQQLVATGGSCGTASIAAGTAGDLLILLGPASNTVTITDTGTLKLGGNRALSANDTLMLVADGTNWNELSFTDN